MYFFKKAKIYPGLFSKSWAFQMQTFNQDNTTNHLIPKMTLSLRLPYLYISLMSSGSKMITVSPSPIMFILKLFDALQNYSKDQRLAGNSKIKLCKKFVRKFGRDWVHMHICRMNSSKITFFHVRGKHFLI
jgi:hypothetical protein